MNIESESARHLKSITLLFVEDETSTRELCGHFLSQFVGVLVTAHNGAEGLEAWRQHKPDIIITDILMPVMDGLAMLQAIRNLDTEIPVIVLSSFEESEYLKRSIDLGVSGYVIKPFVAAKLIESLLKCARSLLVESKLLQARTVLKKQNEFTDATLDGLSAHICVIDDQGEIVITNRAWNDFAIKNNAASESCCRGSNYLDVCRVAAVEDEADIDGFQAGLTAVLNGTLPQFVMEYHCSSPDEVRWFVCKANPFIVDGKSYAVISHEDITSRKLAEEALKEKNEIISRLAVTDDLTGLNNRRFFNDCFSRALSAARRHHLPLSLISIDLDHFKKVNDTFGHSVGDLVLKEFSLLLKTMVRSEDVACRLGGEEFMVLLPNTTCEASVTFAERIRCSFEQLSRPMTPFVTASFGVAGLQEGEDEDDVMRRVDAALYQAKHEGRNRVVAAL